MNTARPAPAAPAFPFCSFALPLVVAVATALAMIGSALLLRADAPQGVKVAIALAPVAPFALMFVVFARMTRRMDEMWVRIQFEALALAFMTVAVATVACGQLQRVGVLPGFNVGFVWAGMAAIYAACFALAARRYR